MKKKLICLCHTFTDSRSDSCGEPNSIKLK